MRIRHVLIAAAATLLLTALATAVPTPSTAVEPIDSVGYVDPAAGEWFLRTATGDLAFFYYGDPGDTPFMGDWNCDGVDTPGLYRESDGRVYLRNRNTQGNADIDYFFGNPGDKPLAGDFDGDGCDTVSLYRPSEARFYIINAVGADGAGIGKADTDFAFGDVGDTPIAGDWDGDGITTIGVHRGRTSTVFLRNSNDRGNADISFIFGDPGTRFVTGDWNGDGADGVGNFTPATRRFVLRFFNTTSSTTAELLLGSFNSRPIAGYVADLAPSPTTTTTTTSTSVPPTTIPPDEIVVFGSGVFGIGADIPAGTYRNSDSSGFCFWERRSINGDVIANNTSIGIQIVAVEITDGTFESRRCGTWSNLLTPRTASPTAPFASDGAYIVGTEVAGGVWQSSGGTGVCEWERLRGFSGEPTDIIANGTATGPVTLLIGSGDAGFSSVRCGVWTNIG